MLSFSPHYHKNHNLVIKRTCPVDRMVRVAVQSCCELIQNGNKTVQSCCKLIQNGNTSVLSCCELIQNGNKSVQSCCELIQNGKQCSPAVSSYRMVIKGCIVTLTNRHANILLSLALMHRLFYID